MTAEELLSHLEGDHMARLRWLVLKEFGVLPGSRRAGRLSDEDCIICGAHMVLDRLEGQAPSAGERGVNKGFDESRFCALGGEKRR